MTSVFSYCPVILSKDIFHISQPAVLMYNCPLTSWDYIVQFKPQGRCEIQGETWKGKKRWTYSLKTVSPLSRLKTWSDGISQIILGKIINLTCKAINNPAIPQLHIFYSTIPFFHNKSSMDLSIGWPWHCVLRQSNPACTDNLQGFFHSALGIAATP